MNGALRGLRDIEGVLGSFLLDPEGQLLAHDMPAVFDEQTLNSAGQRLGQLRAAFEANGHSFEGCTARFGTHLLVLRAAERRTLCVLCPVGTQLKTLQMGINLVARRAATLPLTPTLPAPPAAGQAWSSLPPPPAAVPDPMAAPPERMTPDPMSTTRFFRGRPVR